MFFGFGNRLKLTEVTPGSLVLENRRVAALFDVLFRVLFFGAWYYFFGRGATDLADWFQRVRSAACGILILL